MKKETMRIKTDKNTLPRTTSSFPSHSSATNLNQTQPLKMELESPQRSNASSPEFEFWMVGKNHPESVPSLHTADELFNEGVLLPLHLISSQNPNISPQLNPASAAQVDDPPPPSPKSPEDPDPPAPTAPQSSILSPSTLISSKRWKDIFRKKDSNTPKKKERKPSSSAAAELNINIWPFSRSRSAGTAAAGPKAAAAAAAMRKSSSAPCSRSNSRRAGSGVYVGRASPVWQARRAGKGPAKEKRDLNGGMKGLNLNLNVNSCIGYGRSEAGCRSEEGGSGGLIKFKALFSKKVY